MIIISFWAWSTEPSAKSGTQGNGILTGARLELEDLGEAAVVEANHFSYYFSSSSSGGRLAALALLVVILPLFLFLPLLLLLLLHIHILLLFLLQLQLLMKEGGIQIQIQ